MGDGGGGIDPNPQSQGILSKGCGRVVVLGAGRCKDSWGSTFTASAPWEGEGERKKDEEKVKGHETRIALASRFGPMPFLIPFHRD